jgi:hypothetical protein
MISIVLILRIRFLVFEDSGISWMVIDVLFDRFTFLLRIDFEIPLIIQ